MIDLEKLYERTEGDESQVQFTIQKKDLNMKEIDAIEITDETTKARLDRTRSFT